MWTYTTDSMDFVTVSTGLILPYWMGLPIRYIQEVNNGILIDFQVTNDDIAGFCGISTRNSVNRILRGLREENVITMVNQKIVVLDKDYLKQFIQA